MWTFIDVNGEGNSNPLQYSCLENPMDGGAWRSTVHGVAEPDTTEATWQRCESAFHQCWVWERLQLALCLLFLTILQLCRLPPPLPRSSLQLFLPIHLIPAQVCQLLHCTTGLFKGLCTARFKMFSLLLIFFMYYLCEKYYKPPINLLQYRTI